MTNKTRPIRVQCMNLFNCDYPNFTGDGNTLAYTWNLKSLFYNDLKTKRKKSNRDHIVGFSFGGEGLIYIARDLVFHWQIPTALRRKTSDRQLCLETTVYVAFRISALMSVTDFFRHCFAHRDHLSTENTFA